MKKKGEFQPSGSDDVLSRALETPEHSGRVRGIGSYITPKLWFDLPKEKKRRITKSELEDRDRIRDEEMERTRQEMERTKQEMESYKEEMERTKQEINALKSLLSASNITSSPLSDKDSCQAALNQGAVKPAAAPTLREELIVDADIEYVGGDPPSTRKEGKKLCI